MYIPIYVTILLIALWFQLGVTEGMNSGLHAPDKDVILTIILVCIFAFIWFSMPKSE